MKISELQNQAKLFVEQNRASIKKGNVDFVLPSHAKRYATYLKAECLRAGAKSVNITFFESGEKDDEILLQVKDLKKYFVVNKNLLESPRRI